MEVDELENFWEIAQELEKMTPQKKEEEEEEEYDRYLFFDPLWDLN